MNLHIFYVFHTYIISFIALIANLALIVIIWKKTPIQMKVYSHVLLQNCLSDIFFVIVSPLILFEFQTSNERLFFRSAASWIPSNGYYPCMAFWTYIVGLAGVYWCMYIQITYRYLIIVHSMVISPQKIWMASFITFIISALYDLDFCFSFCFNEDLSANILLTNITPWKYDTTLSSFRSQNFLNIHVIIYFSSLLVIFSIVFILYPYFYYSIVKTIKSSTISTQMLKIQKQLNKRSLYLAITPLIGFTAFAGLFLLLSTSDESNYFFIMVLSMEYIPLLNPIITILTIYRKPLFAKKKYLKTIVTATSNHPK